MLQGMLDKLKEMGSNLKDDATRLRNKSFMNACTAGCAIIANADGVVSPDEKRKMMAFMNSSDVLSLYDSGEVIKGFEAHCAKYEFDPQIGEAEALRVVAGMLAQRHDHIDYFPSFEIVTNSPRHLAWRHDQRHVLMPMVDHVIGLFSNAYLG